VVADKLVKDILAGAKGPIWRGSFAQLVRIMTWAFPTRYVDKLVNAERGLEHVTRR
jgi:1-acylglycerone phosphate reductase